MPRRLIKLHDMNGLSSENMQDYPRPLISVVMPVHNQERVLRETLESVLAQSLRNFELICVDDGSTDSSVAIEREFADRDFRIRLFLRAAEGAARAKLWPGPGNRPLRHLPRLRQPVSPRPTAEHGQRAGGERGRRLHMRSGHF